MKRIFCLYLSLLLLLCACGENASEPTAAPSTTEATVPYVPLEWDLSLTMEDGYVLEGGDDMAMFALQTGAGGSYTPSTEASITICQSHEGKSYTSVLSYAHGVYTITEEEDARSYPYLIYSCDMLPQGAKSDFAEYYLLSDDPEMTIQRYHQHMLSAILQPDFPRTEIVYMDFLSFDRAEAYGAVPVKYAQGENLSLLVGAQFCREGFYVEQLLSEPDPTSSALTETVRRCYTYDFKSLPDDSLPECGEMGIYQGREIPCDDPLFTPTGTDRLPNGQDGSVLNMVSPGGIWQEGEGYVILRYHDLGIWKLQNPLISYVSRYCELILTYYDKNGDAQWQCTGDIFVR